MAKIVTLGEIMLRLSPPGYERFLQASSFDVQYGGAEANVAASLAQLGHHTTFLSKIPNNSIGDAAVGTLARVGVDCSHIVRGGDRLGIYFLPFVLQVLSMTEQNQRLQKHLQTNLISMLFLQMLTSFMYPVSHQS